MEERHCLLGHYMAGGTRWGLVQQWIGYFTSAAPCTVDIVWLHPSWTDPFWLESWITASVRHIGGIAYVVFSVSFVHIVV
jgi:hypothetical protein